MSIFSRIFLDTWVILNFFTYVKKAKLKIIVLIDWLNSWLEI